MSLIMDEMTDTARQHVIRLVDVFGATDGGVGLVTFRMNYEEIAKQAAEGDKRAQYFIKLMSDAVDFVSVFSKGT